MKFCGMVGYNSGPIEYILVVIRIWIRIQEFWRNFIIAVLATVKALRH